MSQFTNEVVGPLTDVELRNTPVPISGTVTATPTGTQDVNVINGSVAVTGPLTDTQLRLTPVDVNFNQTALAPTVTRVAVSTTVTTLLTADSNRKRVVIHNESGTLYVKLGTGATTTDYTYFLTANSTKEIEYAQTAAITAIKASGSTSVQVTALS